jgi:hypothetical protein
VVRKQYSVLTVHVESDVGCKRADHIVVGRLACKHIVEVMSLQFLQEQHVSDAAFRQGFIRAVDFNSVLPPGDPRRRATYRAQGTTLSWAPSVYRCMQGNTGADILLDACLYWKLRETNLCTTKAHLCT